MRWPIVALEGCDGAGKSTLRAQLRARFRDLGIPMLEVGQHGWLDPETARVIVDVRDQRKTHAPEVIAAAYVRDKCAHMRATILPAAGRRLVLCDRSVISDMVYLEVLYGLPADDTLTTYERSGLPLPDAVAFISVPVEMAVRRIASRAKPTRHYERQVDLELVDGVYRRVLPMLAARGVQVLHIDNRGEPPAQVVERQLLKPLLAMLPMSAGRP